jgi:hypothetical protein
MFRQDRLKPQQQQYFRLSRFPLFRVPLSSILLGSEADLARLSHLQGSRRGL